MNFKTKMQKAIHRAQLYAHEASDAKVWMHLNKRKTKQIAQIHMGEACEFALHLMASMLYSAVF